jgi:hypothetical protein
MRFGLFPGERLLAGPPPRGYGQAVLRVGDLVETAYCNLKEWSLDDYLAHWRETASRALGSVHPVIFCSDLARHCAVVFAALPEDDGWRVEQMIVRRDGVNVDGLYLSISGDNFAPSQGASSWRVERAEMEAFLKPDLGVT